MKSRHFLFGIAIVVVACFAASTTHALSPFKKAFDAKYVKNSGSEDFQAAFKKSGCYTCHVKGQKKHVLNAFGLELAELIEGNGKDRVDAAKEKSADGKKDEETKLLKELDEAFKKVESIEGPSGTTYGDLFKAHGLPTADGAKSIRE